MVPVLNLTNIVQIHIQSSVLMVKKRIKEGIIQMWAESKPKICDVTNILFKNSSILIEVTLCKLLYDLFYLHKKGWVEKKS